jgi:hypothetical protein
MDGLDNILGIIMLTAMVCVVVCACMNSTRGGDIQ